MIQKTQKVENKFLVKNRFQYLSEFVYFIKRIFYLILQKKQFVNINDFSFSFKIIKLTRNNAFYFSFYNKY